MPAVVTFDADALTITEVNSGLDVNETDLTEIYSEWKDWLLADPSRMGYPSAFRQVGSDPISDIQNLGTTFFINTGDGWRLKPAEYNHTWQINGNLFTDPAGERRTTPTDGAFTVEVTFFVSNLVDSSVARLDLDQLLQSVYIDPVNGEAGTTEGIGTPTRPVDNIADAFTIATDKNLRSFHIRGSVTLDRNATNWTFIGDGSHLSGSFNIGGFDVDGCLFERVNLTGTMTGTIEAHRCGIQVITGLDGVFSDCGFSANYTVAASSNCIFQHCFSEIAGASTPVCTMAASATVQYRNYSGGLELKGYAAGNNGSVDLDPGRLILNADCTGGTLLVRGQGDLQDNSGAVTLDTAGLLSDPAGRMQKPQLVLQRGADFHTEVL